jgi:hypothetical protein
MKNNGATKNTDHEIWRECVGDYYSDSIFVTEGGGIGINCDGHVIVRSVEEWHRLANITHPAMKTIAKPLADFQLTEKSLIDERRFGLIARLCQKVLQLQRKHKRDLSIVLDDKKTKNGMISFNVWELNSHYWYVRQKNNPGKVLKEKDREKCNGIH